MLKLTVNLDERSYPIYIGQSALQDNGRLIHHIGDCRPIIITNDTIEPLYGEHHFLQTSYAKYDLIFFFQ